MMSAERPDQRCIAGAGIAAAALACLQPGIDPGFLTLLTSAGIVDPADHGWIVGATQTGMAIGAVIAWRMSDRLPRSSITLAAICATLAALATLHAASFWALIALRTVYGAAMGLIYTHVMAAIAAVRPTSAYGIVFLVQLALSTLVALLLPLMAHMFSPSVAITACAWVPLALIVLGQVRIADETRPPAIDRTAGPQRATKTAWALLGATFWFVCTTMIVWSFVGTLAINAGIGETVIGHAVALGSVAGVVTAAIVARDRPSLPLTISGPIAGMAMLAPLFMTYPGQNAAFILSVIFLNIGSTAMVIRCSGAASAKGGTALFRRMVAASHSLGMIAGPVIGATLAALLGPEGLASGALGTFGGACLALMAAARWTRLSPVLDSQTADESRPLRDAPWGA